MAENKEFVIPIYRQTHLDIKSLMPAWNYQNFECFITVNDKYS